MQIDKTPLLSIRPPAKVDMHILLPGSKSITNRALVMAALAKGSSVLSNPSFSEDSRYLWEALKQIGIRIDPLPDQAKIVIDGKGGQFMGGNKGVFLGNAGTAVRFLTSLLCLVPGTHKVDGDPQMRRRPIGGLVDCLNQLGGDVKCIFKNGCPPVIIKGGKLKGGEALIDGRQSSQFISSVAMVSPYAQMDVQLGISGGLVSRGYLDMTLKLMQRFGVNVQRKGYSSLYIKVPQRYQPSELVIEPDAAGANYFLAIAAVTGGRAYISSLGTNSIQAETRFAKVLAQMGCKVVKRKDRIELKGERLCGIEIDMSDIPDSVQTLACVGLFASGPTRIRNVAHLRWKETDRISALCTELKRIGAGVKEFKDGLEIKPALRYAPAVVNTYNDHRMAMSFAVAGAMIPGLKISGYLAVSKSLPEFWDILKSQGFELVFS
jgi:3-phosphoshikimate 1-carboxyvinyltransferase